VAIAGAIGSGVGKQLTLRTTVAIDSRFVVELAARHHAGARRDSMMWRQDVDHGQKHELGGATLIGETSSGPLQKAVYPSTRWHDATRLRPLCSVNGQVARRRNMSQRARLLTSSIRNLWRSCPRSALSCAHQPLLGQLRLFGGVRCYRQSLRTDGIETQKLGETICDVPTAESI
jgi:hypothetical protein